MNGPGYSGTDALVAGLLLRRRAKGRIPSEVLEVWPHIRLPRRMLACREEGKELDDVPLLHHRLDQFGSR